MVALLDVNVLIGLLDTGHVSHDAALRWFGSNAPSGWASCAITQNGCMRIMSHAQYPRRHCVRDIAGRLRAMTTERVHEFWPDDVSLLDDERIEIDRIHGPRQLTDVYLLALAVAHGGTLVTFDRSIALSAVRGAAAEHLTIL